MSAKALTVCPEEACAQKRWGKGRVKRAISVGGGLIFKGSGFYTTDYRSEKYKEAAKKDSAAAPSSSASTPKDAGSSATPKDAGSSAAKADSKPPAAPSGKPK